MIKKNVSMPDKGGSSHADIIKWAYEEVTKSQHSTESFGDYEIVYNNERIILIQEDVAVGYLGYEKILDGNEVTTLSVHEDYRGKGIAKKIYSFILTKGPLYSGDMQTPESRGLWVSFYKKYNDRIKAINIKTKQMYDVELDGKELSIPDEGVDLYSDDYDDIRLVLK